MKIDAWVGSVDDAVAIAETVLAEWESAVICGWVDSRLKLHGRIQDESSDADAEEFVDELFEAAVTEITA